MTSNINDTREGKPVVMVDQFTPGYQFMPTPKFIQNNHS